MSRLTYDWPSGRGPAPGPGDVLRCVRRRDGEPTGTAYLIVSARPVRMRELRTAWDGSLLVRMRYDVGRVTAWDLGVRVETLQWHHA